MGPTITGQKTLRETEVIVNERLDGLGIDAEAMWAVSNIYRASATVRRHLERTVLREAGLTWTGFVVLWVVWIWQEIETRHAAAESGISKGTLTGVVKTLRSAGYVERAQHETDGRRVVLTLTAPGAELMEGLFPRFNQGEAYVVGDLASRQRKDLARTLRRIIERLEVDNPNAGPDEAIETS